MNETTNIQGAAEQTHRDFLQTMYLYFGLEKSLDPIKIRLSDDLKVANAWFYGTNPPRIVIGNKNPLEIPERVKIEIVKLNSAHETSHYLHLSYLARRYESTMYDRLSKQDELAKELIAELGTHLFFHKRGELDFYRRISQGCAYQFNEVLDMFFGRGLSENPEVRLMFEEDILKQISGEKDFFGISRHLKRWGLERRGLTKRLKEIYKIKCG